MPDKKYYSIFTSCYSAYVEIETSEGCGYNRYSKMNGSSDFYDIIPMDTIDVKGYIMKLQSCLLCDTVQPAANDHLLVLNSAADPFVQQAINLYTSSPTSNGTLTLAEDNIAIVNALFKSLPSNASFIRHVPLHDYLLHCPAATMDKAVMNLLYQPSNNWTLYGVHIAAHALRQRGRLYVVGAKDRGILSMEKRIREYFGNVETLVISKGHRVLCAQKDSTTILPVTQSLHESVLIPRPDPVPIDNDASHLRFTSANRQDNATLVASFTQGNGPGVFANNKLDEGTRLLLEVVEVYATDEILDIGCGAGFIGLHVARLARKGSVTMVDVSLAAVATAQQAIEESRLTNIRVLPSDGVQAVLSQRFDLVVTNPPFHQGGIQTTEIAERFIRGAAQVLRPQGRFYLVANRFLKYESILHSCFGNVNEVGGDTRYKVLRASKPHRHR